MKVETTGWAILNRETHDEPWELWQSTICDTEERTIHCFGSGMFTRGRDDGLLRCVPVTITAEVEE